MGKRGGLGTAMHYEHAEKLGALHDPLLGLATAVRVCRHHLDMSQPDLHELRMLIGEMVEVADHSIGILRR